MESGFHLFRGVFFVNAAFGEVNGVCTISGYCEKIELTRTDII